MVKMHISHKGIPVSCPAKIQCRLAPDMAHFDKVEQAEAFADELNQLKLEQRSYLGLSSKQVKDMTNAELYYTQTKIKNEAKDNDNYKNYKGSIKWQKEVRSKSAREMQAYLDENNKLANEVGKKIDETQKARKEYLKDKDKDKYQVYLQKRSELNELRDKNTSKIAENIESFNKLVNKKAIAEQKVLSMMRTQAKHNETKAILTDVEGEIEGRNKQRKNLSPTIENLEAVFGAGIAKKEYDEAKEISSVISNYNEALSRFEKAKADGKLGNDEESIKLLTDLHNAEDARRKRTGWNKYRDGELTDYEGRQLVYANQIEQMGEPTAYSVQLNKDNTYINYSLLSVDKDGNINNLYVGNASYGEDNSIKKVVKYNREGLITDTGEVIKVTGTGPRHYYPIGTKDFGTTSHLNLFYKEKQGTQYKKGIDDPDFLKVHNPEE